MRARRLLQNGQALSRPHRAPRRSERVRAPTGPVLLAEPPAQWNRPAAQRIQKPGRMCSVRPNPAQSASRHGRNASPPHRSTFFAAKRNQQRTRSRRTSVRHHTSSRWTWIRHPLEGVRAVPVEPAVIDDSLQVHGLMPRNAPNAIPSRVCVTWAYARDAPCTREHCRALRAVPKAVVAIRRKPREWTGLTVGLIGVEHHEEFRRVLKSFEGRICFGIVRSKVRNLLRELLTYDLQVKEPEGIVAVDRIPACVAVQVQPPRQPDRVRLRGLTDTRIVRRPPTPGQAR
jgi:hypothetical protein